ncbi:MAG: phage regulatory protein/antirepressor Ant [Porticoccaceae bacterium]|nr:phage regulatory protein/antirepressor Ant [Porticoccaceae bacterium]
MNSIVAINPAGLPVTTSLAIADGVGNPHKSVLQLIRQNTSDLEEFGRVAFEMRPFETAGGTQNREVAILNEQQSTLLLTYMRNNDVVRAFKKRLVKAFFELASRPVDPLEALRDPAAMRNLLLGYSERVIALEAAVEEQAPKVSAFKLLSEAEGSMCITDAAKHLDMRPKDLTLWLQANDWIYRRSGGKSWIAYQPRIKQQVLVHKVTTVSRDDGTEKTVEQVRVTPKGLARLAEELQGEPV